MTPLLWALCFLAAFCFAQFVLLAAVDARRTRLRGLGRLQRLGAATRPGESPDEDSILRGSRGGPEGYDGVAELWWDSVEDLAAPLADPAVRAAGEELLEDERRFIDLARSPLWLAREHEIVADADGSGPA